MFFPSLLQLVTKFPLLLVFHNTIESSLNTAQSIWYMLSNRAAMLFSLPHMSFKSFTESGLLTRPFFFFSSRRKSSRPARGQINVTFFLSLPREEIREKKTKCPPMCVKTGRKGTAAAAPSMPAFAVFCSNVSFAMASPQTAFKYVKRS